VTGVTPNLSRQLLLFSRMGPPREMRTISHPLATASGFDLLYCIGLRRHARPVEPSSNVKTTPLSLATTCRDREPTDAFLHPQLFRLPFGYSKERFVCSPNRLSR
jgi:hypothetical protein